MTPLALTAPLDRPPGDRYRETAPGDGGPGDPQPAGRPEPEGSAARALAFGIAGAIAVAALLVVFAGIFTFTLGLLVVAFFMGRIVALLVRAGGNDALSAAARQTLAIVLAIVGIAVAQVGTWIVAQAEGGVLPLGDYLLDAFGPLVPLEFIVATAAAWWTAR